MRRARDPLTAPISLAWAVAVALSASVISSSAMAQSQTAPSPAAPAPPAPAAAAAPAMPPAAAPPAAAPPPGNAPPAYPPPAYPPPAYPPGYPPPAYPPPGPYYYPPPAPYYYPQPGYYQPAGYPPPGYPPLAAVRRPVQHLHDGFYLRLQLGYSFLTSVSANVAGVETSYSGNGVGMGMAIGAAIVPNLIVFGTGFLSGGFGSTLSVGSFHADSGQDLNLYGLGAGVAYYFQPINMYLAAAVSGMKADLTPTDQTASNHATTNLTRTGPGVQLLVGKEWWVSENWGLGIAAEILFSSMPDATDPSTTWRGSAFNLVFSATYN
jgi:hypothetical protein